MDAPVYAAIGLGLSIICLRYSAYMALQDGSLRLVGPRRWGLIPDSCVCGFGCLCVSFCGLGHSPYNVQVDIALMTLVESIL